MQTQENKYYAMVHIQCITIAGKPNNANLKILVLQRKGKRRAEGKLQ